MCTVSRRLTPFVVAFVVLATAGPTLTGPAMAAERGAVGGHSGGRGFTTPHGFHDGFHRDFHASGRPFHQVDPGRWRAGHWHHGFHDGQLGWWWVVGDGWYYYPSAVYPYPQYWYYCPSAGAYYPYVSACPEGWTPVVPQ